MAAAIIVAVVVLVALAILIGRRGKLRERGDRPTGWTSLDDRPDDS